MFSKIDLSEIKFNEIVKSYTDIIKNNGQQISNNSLKNKICEFENSLQLNEIISHLNLNNLTENDIEKILWCENHAKNFRHWLNSIKLFLIFGQFLSEVNMKKPVDINAFVAAFLNDNHEFLQTIFS